MLALISLLLSPVLFTPNCLLDASMALFLALWAGNCTLMPKFIKQRKNI
jgi:hypothetical protein